MRCLRRSETAETGHVDLRAECHECGKTFSRTTWPGKGKSGAQGRPLGMLAMWLVEPCHGDRNAHPAKNVLQIDFEGRKRARQALLALGDSFHSLASGEPFWLP